MNNLAMNICEAIMPINDSGNVTIVANSVSVYDNVEVNDYDTKGVYFTNDNYAPYVAYDNNVEVNVRNKVDNDIDYEDIYDNINDYEYPYNHINRDDLVQH